MKVSLNWLKNYVNIDAGVEEVSVKLTASGLEIEGVEQYSSVQGGLKGLVVGEVLTCVQHPNADRLKVTTVNIGAAEALNIVCGAPNVAAGQKVIVATVGTTLYPKGGEAFEIKKSKIRGEVSEGMICAEDEIGLGTDHSGIIILPDSAKAGEQASSVLGVESDYILEIGLTANRGDAASHLGVARDLSALFRTPLTRKEENVNIPEISTDWSINLPDTDCIRYSGLVIEGVEVKESPDWLKSKLQSIGLSPINNIVDITNFVLHDIGQPIHAFDAEAVKGKKIEVKKASAGRKFITLDGIERELKGNELMIWNAQEPMAIAGVFGGKSSGVSEKTKSVFIESACFNPSSIRKTAKAHGLSTDASFRYERGTDPEITVYALKKVAQLILELGGGKIVSPIIDIYPKKVEHAKVSLEKEYLERLTGHHISEKEIEEILHFLEIKITTSDDKGWNVEVPPVKGDVTRPADLVEEIVRIYGLDNIPIPEKVSISYGHRQKPDYNYLAGKVASHLASRGFVEIMTNSMTKKSRYSEDVLEKTVSIKNPLSSDMEIMRPGMLASMLEVAAYNKNRKNADLKLFEFANTYFKTGDAYKEIKHLSMLVCGSWNGENWHDKSRKADFYDLKQEVNEVLRLCGIKLPLKFWNFDLLKRAESDYSLVRIAPVGKELLKEFDLRDEIYYAELNWDELTKRMTAGTINAMPPPRFPEVRRDLSLVLDKATGFDKVMQIIKETDKGLVQKVSVFDVYEGDRIEKGKKSYSVSIILQHTEKTLSDKEIDLLMQKLIDNFENKIGALIRK